MWIPTNVNNIVYPCKIYHLNVNNKDSVAQCDICQSWVYMKCNKLILLTTNISKAQMIHDTVSLIAVTFYLLEHKQIKTSSLPSRQQTLSLKVPIVTMIKKVYFYYNVLICLPYIINSITLLQKKTMTLKMLLTPNSMTVTKFNF